MNRVYGFHIEQKNINELCISQKELVIIIIINCISHEEQAGQDNNIF